MFLVCDPLVPMQCFCYYNKKVRSAGAVWLPPALTKDTRITDTRCFSFQETFNKGYQLQIFKITTFNKKSL